MIKSLTSIILASMFTVSAFASSLNTNPTLVQTVEKFDYMLTSHPLAHQEDFQAQTIQNFKSEMKQIVKTSTREELLASFNTLIEKIPAKNQRIAFRRVLENSTKEELNTFISTPGLMNQALAGEGANFAMNSVAEEILSAALFVGVAVGLIYIVHELFVEEEEYEFEIYMNK